MFQTLHKQALAEFKNVSRSSGAIVKGTIVNFTRWENKTKKEYSIIYPRVLGKNGKNYQPYTAVVSIDSVVENKDKVVVESDAFLFNTAITGVTRKEKKCQSVTRRTV